MRQKRNSCAEFESVPGGSTADAVSQQDRRGLEEKQFTRAQGKRASDEELHSWLARMRGRCQVLESTPEPCIADAGYSGGSAPSSALQSSAEVLESVPTECRADAKWEAAPATSKDEATDNATPPVASAKRVASLKFAGKPQAPTAEKGLELEELERLSAGVRNGEPLPRKCRAQVWAHHLQLSAEALQSNDDTDMANAVPTVLQLVSAGIEKASGQGDTQCKRVALSFTEKRLPWLSDGNGGAAGVYLFTVLAQLLKYHSPPAAEAIEKVAAVAGADLDAALDAACGGVDGLIHLLLTPQEAGQDEALLLLCDIVVVEAAEMLLLFGVVSLLSEAKLDAFSNFDQLREHIRRKVLCQLGSSTTAEILNLVATARKLQEATPLSLNAALSFGGLAGSRLRFPLCTVAADEVLHHVYERPSGAWRLVVVDVRRRTSAFALPVCLRLDGAQNRQEVLEEMPFEDSIHMCLMGDSRPMPGEEAFELCQRLTCAPASRRHISVADGGWPAISSLARSMGVELMRVEPPPEEPPAAPSKTSKSPEKPGTTVPSLKIAAVSPNNGPEKSTGLQSARVAVAEVADTAAAVGHKVAQRMLAGANRAFQKFSDVQGGTSGTPEGGPK